MDFFSLLREHARLRTQSPAVSSARRSMTYRKLWSRIERATARLQGEWGVGRDDTVAYLGNSHPDALVLFFALARCGSRLLPLSPALADAERSLLLREFQPRWLIIDDDLHETQTVGAVQVLSSLIATRCPYEPGDVVEDMSRPVLLCNSVQSPATGQISSLKQLREEGKRLGSTSLPVEVDKVGIANFFEGSSFSSIVLPVLERGACLVMPS